MVASLAHFFYGVRRVIWFQEWSRVVGGALHIRQQRLGRLAGSVDRLL